MAEIIEYEDLKKTILGKNNISANHLTAIGSQLSSKCAADDLPSLLPVVFNCVFSEDKSIQKAAIPVLQKLANLLEQNNEVKNDEWWPDLKSNIANSISKISAMFSEGREEWCTLWCSFVIMLGKDLRPAVKTVNTLLKVAEKAFKVSSERDRGFECWRKLIDNFALCPNDMNSKRRLILLLIPLQAQNHGSKDSCLSKLNTWKHLLTYLDANNEVSLSTVVPPFLKFMYEGVGALAPACDYWPRECAQIFKLLLTTDVVFRPLSHQFIKDCGTCVISLKKVDTDECIKVWTSMIAGVKKMGWPDNKVAEMMQQLKRLHESIGTSVLFTDILVATYNSGISTSLVCKHYNTFISMIISPHVICNIKEPVLKSFMDIMDSMNSFLLSESTFQLIIDRLHSLFEADIKEEMKNDLGNNLRIIWSSFCDAMCKWIVNGGHSSEDRTKEDMRLIHNVLIFGITRLQSQWNKSILRSWKLLFSESLKYFLLLMSVNSEQFVVDLIERMVKAIKEQQMSLLISVEISSILLEFSQSKESNSLSSLLMEIGEKIFNLIPTDMSKGLSLLNLYLKVLLVAVRSRPMLATVCISVTENLSQIKMDLPVTENQKISARVMKTHMQLVSLKTVKTMEKPESPVPPPSPAPTMTSFLHRLAKAEGNKTKSRVGNSQVSQETKQVSQLSPRPVKPMFIDSSSQDDYVFVPPKKTIIPLTEHQKEHMARRSDIPALYQDLSQDSQSINLESISFSHSAPKADSKSLRKSISPSKSPIKHFSAIESGRTSPIQINSSSNSLSKSPNKQCNSPRKVISPFKHPDNSGIKLLSQVEEATTPTKTITSDNSPSKIRSSPRLSNETLPIMVNREIDFENICQSTNKNKATTPIKVNACLNDSTVLLESTSKLNKALDFENDNASVENKRVLSPRKKSVSINTPDENVNANENRQKFKLQGELIIVEDVINLEDSTAKAEGLNDVDSLLRERSAKKNWSANKLSSSDNTLLGKDDIKVENCRDAVGYVEKKSVEKETPKSMENNSSEKTINFSDEKVQIVKEIKKELFKVKECTRVDETSTMKEELVQVKNEIKSKRRKSVPAKFSPIKTRRSSQRLQFFDVTVLKHRRSLSNTKKSSVNRSPINHNNVNHRKVVKKTPEVNEKESKVIKCDRNQNEEGKKKRKLNGSTEKVSGKRAKFNIDEELEGLNKEKSESITQSKDCNSNTDVPMNEESESKQIKINEDIKLLETSVKPKEKILGKECTDDEGLNKENIDLVQNECPQVFDGTSIKSPATISRNLFSTNSEDDVKSSEERTSSVAKNTETMNILQETDKCLTPVKANKITNSKLAMDQETSGTSLTEQTSLLSHIVQSKGIIKSPRKLLNDSPFKSNKDIAKESVKGSGDKEPVLCVTNLTDVCRTPVKHKDECEITARTHVILTLDNNVSSCPTYEEMMDISMSAEDIAMLEGNKLSKQKTVKSEDKIIDEVVLLDSNSCEAIKHDVPLLVHSPKKKIDTTPQKISKEQIAFLKHSPILDKVLGKVDYTPPKEIALDQSVSTVTNSSQIEVISKNSPESSKIVNKKLTSPNLTDWVLRTPIKKSSEIVNSDQSVPETAPENIQQESEDLIPCSQEVVDKSEKFLKIVVEKLNDLKSSPSKLHSLQLKRSSTSAQNELGEESVADKTDIDSLTSPKKNTTPVKKSVCRRLVIDNDKATLETEEELDEENNFSNPSKIDNLDVPVLTSDRDDNMCKDLIVEQALQNSPEKILPQSIVDKDEEKTVSGDLAQNEIGGEMNQLTILRKSYRIMPQSPKKSSEREVVVLSSPKSPRRRTSQLMALAFKKDDSGDGQCTPINRKLKKNQLFRPIDSSTVESQPTEPTHLTEAWVCRIYSPSASPNTSILKRKVNLDTSPEPSSPVCKDKRKRVSFLDPVVSESLVFSKSEFGKGQIVRSETKQAEPRYEEPEILSQGSVTEEVESGNSQVLLFPALESCKHPVANVLERDVTKQWLVEMEASLERFGVTTIGDLCKLSEATIERLPFPPPKVNRLRSLLQEYFDHVSNSPPKKLKVSPTKLQSETEQNVPNIAVGEESLSDITGKVTSYFRTHPGLVETLGNTLDVDTIMSMLNIAVASLKSKQNS